MESPKMPVPMTVVETPAFVRQSLDVWTDPERFEMIGYLAANPEAGEIMPETGGARKLRWGVAGRGKRSGARVIYYFHNHDLPLFLLNVFAKNQQQNLTNAERHEIKSLIPRLVESYCRRRSEK